MILRLIQGVAVIACLSYALLAIPAFADNPNKLPCPESSVGRNSKNVYNEILAGGYLRVQYLQDLFRLRSHYDAGKKYFGQPLSLSVKQSDAGKEMLVGINFHEGIRFVLDKDGNIGPGSDIKDVDIKSSGPCLISITLGKWRDVVFRYVGNSEEQFIGDFLFAGTYFDQAGNSYVFANGLAQFPKQTFSYEFGADLVGDVCYWAEGLLVKNKHTQYQAFRGENGVLKLYPATCDESVESASELNPLLILKRKENTQKNK